ncbi:MAG: hypothetical protein KO316_02820 [Methanobacterium sp.]|nr:hypothetical protein [Methanobacterium sp.]
MDNCTVFTPEKQLYDEAMQTYLKYDGTLSLTDTVSLELMKIFNIHESFDSDLRESHEYTKGGLNVFRQ